MYCLVYFTPVAKEGNRMEVKMSVNGVTNTASSYGTTAYEQGKSYTKKTEDTSSKSSAESTGVTYEPSSKGDRTAIIEQLKADSQSRTESFRKMVTDMLNQQGFAVKNSDDMWRLLAKGDFTVDAKTAQEAKDAISENGEWGVNKTAQRMFDFAKAYAGDDEAKMEKMMNAFKKGFEQAEKLWGGKLPDISYQTYDKMYDLYDEYKKGLGSVTQTSAAEG